MLNVRINEGRRLLLWLILAALAALLTYVAFRGYISAGLLLQFSNSFYC
jgi:hypothetical protein